MGDVSKVGQSEKEKENAGRSEKVAEKTDSGIAGEFYVRQRRKDNYV
jgi:hypothetical protein